MARLETVKYLRSQLEESPSLGTIQPMSLCFEGCVTHVQWMKLVRFEASFHDRLARKLEVWERCSQPELKKEFSDGN